MGDRGSNTAVPILCFAELPGTDPLGKTLAACRIGGAAFEPSDSVLSAPFRTICIPLEALGACGHVISFGDYFDLNAVLGNEILGTGTPDAGEALLTEEPLKADFPGAVELQTREAICKPD